MRGIYLKLEKKKIIFSEIKYTKDFKTYFKKSSFYLFLIFKTRVSRNLKNQIIIDFFLFRNLEIHRLKLE